MFSSSSVLLLEDLCYYFSLSPSMLVSLESRGFDFRSFLSDRPFSSRMSSGYRVIKALDGLFLTLHERECLGVIGESGSGKSTLLYSILNLPFSNLYFRSGSIKYFFSDGSSVDLFSLSESELQRLRAFDFGFIPQLPKSSLNPWLDIGFQVGEVLFDHFSSRQAFIFDRVVEFLGKVSFPGPDVNYTKYVNQLSRGEAQRVCIAQALLADPRVLLADEPFTALDVINSSRIIMLFKSLKDSLPISFLFTTHNLAAAFSLSDTLAVLYGGEIVEVSPSRKFFDSPLHPYSRALLESSPWYVDYHGIDLSVIPGDLPDPSNFPSGCKFHPRCAYASSRCVKFRPRLTDINGVLVSCHLFS